MSQQEPVSFSGLNSQKIRQQREQEKRDREQERLIELRQQEDEELRSIRTTQQVELERREREMLNLKVLHDEEEQRLREREDVLLEERLQRAKEALLNPDVSSIVNSNTNSNHPSSSNKNYGPDTLPAKPQVDLDEMYGLEPGSELGHDAGPSSEDWIAEDEALVKQERARQRGGMLRRTPGQVILDRTEISRLMRRGWSKLQIAEKLKMPISMVNHDWGMVVKEAQEYRTQDTVAKINEVLEQISEIKREAWDAWEKSKRNVMRQWVEEEHGMIRESNPNHDYSDVDDGGNTSLPSPNSNSQSKTLRYVSGNSNAKPVVSTVPNDGGMDGNTPNPKSGPKGNTLCDGMGTQQSNNSTSASNDLSTIEPDSIVPKSGTNSPPDSKGRCIPSRKPILGGIDDENKYTTNKVSNVEGTSVQDATMNKGPEMASGSDSGSKRVSGRLSSLPGTHGHANQVSEDVRVDELDCSGNVVSPERGTPMVGAVSTGGTLSQGYSSKTPVEINRERERIREEHHRARLEVRKRVVKKGREGRNPASEYLKIILECLKIERDLQGLSQVKGRDGGGQINWDALAQGIPDEITDTVEEDLVKAMGYTRSEMGLTGRERVVIPSKYSNSLVQGTPGTTQYPTEAMSSNGPEIIILPKE